MKTWESIARRIERNRLPYKVERYNLSQRGTLVTLNGEPVAYTVQGARDVLSAPGHPDSKRQARRKARDLARYGSRCFKTSEVVFTSFLEREESNLRARFLASKLLGKRFMCPKHGNKRFSFCMDCHETIDPPAIFSDAFRELERKLQERRPLCGVTAMPYEDDEVYTEWLAAAPKGVRWDKAQEMYQVYQERRKRQAAEVARLLLGKRICPVCKGSDLVFHCPVCKDTGENDA